MGKILTLGCKVKPRGVPKMCPIYKTDRANILKDPCFTDKNVLDTVMDVDVDWW